uniref:Uncharacterized protein n=1 Tax=Siphoviridae sp. ctDuC3 TaxID=2827563 RepID=A0A8S5LMG7_9CAUD|nr:MAG TPA: hypothetical protein [Siphoviridae sp. ctDuC3]
MIPFYVRGMVSFPFIHPCPSFIYIERLLTPPNHRKV